jgi:3-phenylpropionate/trans-cinnamate dioxygenase ferredoxin reductase subunit
MAGETVVIAGGGQGGFQVAASLRQAGFDGRVLLIGDEPELPYQRPPLSKAYLSGQSSREMLSLRPEQFYADQQIELLAGERVTVIDRHRRRLQLASAGELGYDHLVLAVGARNRALPVPGADLDGVLGLRTVADADALRERLKGARDVAIVGAGFIGLEFAAVAAAQGLNVQVLEAARRPMSRAVSAHTSDYFTQAHTQSGVKFNFGACVVRLHGSGGRVTAVEIAGGQRLPADLVLVGIGVIPNTELAIAAELATGDGVLVDEHLVSSDPRVSAIGDCAQYPSRFTAGLIRLESVQNAVDQARTVAARLVGNGAPYAKVPWFWSDQGKLKLQIVGVIAGHDATVLRGDPDRGGFSVFCYRGGKLLGIESVNRPADHMVGRRLLSDGIGLTPEQAADEGFDLKAHAATPAKPSEHVA